MHCALIRHNTVFVCLFVYLSICPSIFLPLFFRFSFYTSHFFYTPAVLWYGRKMVENPSISISLFFKIPRSRTGKPQKEEFLSPWIKSISGSHWAPEPKHPLPALKLAHNGRTTTKSGIGAQTPSSGPHNHHALFWTIQKGSKPPIVKSWF